MCGIGTYTFSDGDYQEIIYDDDVKNGYGIMHYISENKRYEGNYKNDKKEGYGEL